jgi:hypothetical protein
MTRRELVLLLAALVVALAYLGLTILMLDYEGK